MPKVSIIIPNYNHHDYLEKRIESVLHQTFDDFEVILMDDCSKDKSLDIIEKYKNHPKVSKVFINQINSGSTFKQWNKGIKEARGTYIWIAESDDWADPDFLTLLVPFLEANPSVGLAYSQSYQIDTTGKIIGSMAVWTDNISLDKWKSNYIEKGKVECTRYLIQKNTIPNASAVVFRKENYLKLGGADESYQVIGDWKLWFDLLMNADVAFYATPLNYFRFHQGNVRQTKIQAFENEKLRIYDHFRVMLTLKQENLSGLFRNYYIHIHLQPEKSFSSLFKNSLNIFKKDMNMGFRIPYFLSAYYFNIFKNKASSFRKSLLSLK